MKSGRKFSALLAVVFLLTFMMSNIAMAADTKNESVIKEKFHQMVFYNKDGELNVKEIISFKNTTADRFIGNTGTSGKTEVLKVSLPQGYQNLDVQSFDKNSLVISQDGFITTTPVEANEELNVIFSYTIPQSSDGRYTLDKYAKYVTDELTIFHPQGTMKISGAGIFSFKAQNVPGQGNFDVYGVEPPNVGKKVDINVDLNGGSGLSKYDDKLEFHPHVASVSQFQTIPLIGKNPHIFTAFVLIVLAALISAIYILKKKQREEHSTNFDDEQFIKLYTQLKNKELRLLNKIADLDKKYEEGEIDEDEHKNSREEYKKLLVKVKLRKNALEEELNEDDDE